MAKLEGGREMQNTATEIDPILFSELYMSGLNDIEVGKIIGCGKSRIQKERAGLELPPNKDIFIWQKSLESDELEKIPPKYRR